MADTKPYPISFKGTVTPTATKFLKSEALVMDFTSELDLDATDAANIKNIEKAFQDLMTSALKKQLGHLNTWLAEKEKNIAALVARYEALKKEGFPATPQAAAARGQTFKQLAMMAVEMQTLPDEYKQIVADWAENARQQQGLIAMQQAVKVGRVKTYNNKCWRVRAGQIVKAVLVVAAIAVSIAAIVVTAGSATPLVIGLAAAGAALAGISSLAGLGKSLKDNATIEKKLMANVTKDVETVKNALKPVASCNSSIAKHITELRNLMKIRQDNIRQYEAEIQKQTVTAKSYATALAGLKGNPGVEAADLAKRQKYIDTLNADLKSVADKIKKLQAANAGSQSILDDLTAMNVELDKISGQSANSILGNLKERFTGLDGWVDLGNTVGGLMNSASSL